MSTRVVASDLFDNSAAPCLIGGRHRQQGSYAFPFPNGLEAVEYDRVALHPIGALWSWTIQRFRPKSPPYLGTDTFQPYAVGYIELPGQVIVEARLVNVDFAALKIGMSFRTTIIPFATDADGTSVLTFAFEPAKGFDA